MKHYIKGKDGWTHTVEEYGWSDGKVMLCIDNYKFVTLKMYFRHERTLSDHMGNTSCGYYANVPLYLYNGKMVHKRVYLDLAR